MTERESQKPTSPTGEQVPHSGVHGYENPGQDFSANLQEALESGDIHHVELDNDGNLIINVPNTIGDFREPTNSVRTDFYESLTQPNNAPTLVPEKRGKRRIAAIAAGAVGAALVGGLGAMQLFGGEKTDTPNARVETSAPVEPGSESIQPTHEATFRLDAEKYIDSPERLIVDFVDAFNTWQNSGVTAEAANADKRFEMSDEEYASYLNQSSDESFISSILVPDWQSNPNLVDWVSAGVRNHQTTSWAAIITSDDNGTEQNEPYRRYVDLNTESIVVQDAETDQIIVSATWTGRDNADQNNIDDIRTGGIDPNQESGDYTLTFIKGVDGNMLLSDVESYID